MNLFEVLSEPAAREHVVRCRACRHVLRAPESRWARIGPECAERLGLARRKPVRIRAAAAHWMCEGQLDLLAQRQETESRS
ncbi:DUF6011 domain-containing protein [Nonomuraea sp. NPDC050394]|uniref:DUF6011 domain-containing protein n=2 Tax=unclassified Nonomuraea TaxID=2593643 RepID=UPI00378C6BDE